MIRILFLSVLFFLVACQGEKKETTTVKEAKVSEEQATVDSLSTFIKKQSFLQKLYALDQRVRLEEKQALFAFGIDSDEVLLAKEKVRQTSVDNFKLMECYLNTYGYPSFELYSRRAVDAPWVIIHHYPNVGEEGKRNFHHVYDAWQKKDISASDVITYLSAIYRNEYQEELILPNPYTEALEMKILMEKLGLAVE